MFIPSDSPTPLSTLAFCMQGPGTRTGCHQHHNLHLILSRQGVIEVDIQGVTRETAGVLTPKWFSHGIDARRQPRVIFVFIDPESRQGELLERRCGQEPVWIDASHRDELLDSLSAQPTREELDLWMRETLSSMTDGETPYSSSSSPRIKKALKMLQTMALYPAPSLEDLATQVGLSASRFMHAFKKETGSPFRAYVRWLRLQRAVSAMPAARTLADVAHEAGFYDQPHMTKTFHEMFGISPQDLQQHLAHSMGGAMERHDSGSQ